MGNKIKQYVPYVIISIPLIFWYCSVIIGHDTHAIKLTYIGFLSALHIMLYTGFYFAKKDFEKK